MKKISVIWPGIILAYLSLLALGFADNIRGPLFPELLLTFHLDDQKGSLYFVMASAFAFFGGLVCRRLLQHFSMLRVLMYSCGMMVISVCLMALTSHLYILMLAAGVLGFSFGLLGVVQNLMVAKSCSEKYRARAFAGLHSMYGLASLTAPLGVALWAKNSAPGTLSMQPAFLLAAALPLASLGLALFFSGKEKSWNWNGHQDAETPEKKLDFMSYLFASILSLYVVGEIIIGTRLPLFLRRAESWNLEKSSLYLTYFFVGLLSGRVLLTFLHLKLNMHRVLVGSLLGAIVTFALGMGGFPFGFVVSGFAMAPFYPVAMAYLNEVFHENLHRTLSLCIGLSSLFIVIMNLVVGWISDHYGIRSAMGVGFIALVLCLVALIAFSRALTRKQLATVLE